MIAPASAFGVERMGLYWTAAPDAVSLAIRWFTRPGWGLPLAPVSHVGLAVWYVGGWAEAHEALWSSGGWMIKPLVKLRQWADKSPEHVLIERPLSLTGPEMDWILADSRSMTGSDTYAVRTILTFALCESIAGRLLGILPADVPGQVICSEGVARLLGQYAPRYDLRPAEDYPYAALSPAAMLREYDRRFSG